MIARFPPFGVCRPVLFLAALVWLGGHGPAQAAASSQPLPEAQALVQRLVLDRAAFVAAERRVADEREARLLAELAEKDRKLRAEQRAKRASTAGWAKAAAALKSVTLERLKLVDELAARDRQLAAEIGEYREQIASIADSPDPRKRAALARYAEGERVGAFDDLVSIQEDLDKANDKASAAGWRELGALALDLKDRGEKDTNAVIALFERAQRKDPEHAWGWIELRRLYQEAGRMADSRKAAEEALRLAQGDRERSAAMNELGATLEQFGDFVGARSLYESSLKLAQGLLAKNPESVDAKLDLTVSLSQLGDLLQAADEPRAARERYEAARKILQALVEADPGNALLRRDLAVILMELGAVQITLDDLPGARSRYEQSLEIRKSLADASPESAVAQRDLSAILLALGDVFELSDEPTQAWASYEAALRIRLRLAVSNPASAKVFRDVIDAHLRLGSPKHLRGALRLALALESEGRLAPQDAGLVAAIQKAIEELEGAETPP